MRDAPTAIYHKRIKRIREIVKSNATEYTFWPLMLKHGVLIIEYKPRIRSSYNLDIQFLISGLGNCHS